MAPRRATAAKKEGRFLVAGSFAVTALITFAVAVYDPNDTRLRTTWRYEGPSGVRACKKKFNPVGREKCCTDETKAIAYGAVKTAIFVAFINGSYAFIKKLLFSGEKMDLGPGGGERQGGGEGRGSSKSSSKWALRLAGIDLNLPSSSFPQSTGDRTWPMAKNRIAGVSLRVPDVKTVSTFYEYLGMENLQVDGSDDANSEHAETAGRTLVGAVLRFDGINQAERTGGFSLGSSKSAPSLGGKQDHFVLSLVSSKGAKINHDKAFGHVTIATQDVQGLFSRAIAVNGSSVKRPGPVAEGGTQIGIVQDPAGYRVMLLQRNRPYMEPLCRVKLNVRNLEASIAFYRKILGMDVYRTHNSAKRREKLAWMGYGKETEGTVLELGYHYGAVTPHGDGFSHLTIVTPNLAAAVQALRKKGESVEASSSYSASILDPDGFKVTLVDADHYNAEMARAEEARTAALVEEARKTVQDANAKNKDTEGADEDDERSKAGMETNGSRDSNGNDDNQNGHGEGASNPNNNNNNKRGDRADDGKSMPVSSGDRDVLAQTDKDASESGTDRQDSSDATPSGNDGATETTSN
eukprot:jgi/Bigna1/125784/aug1.1_g492